MQCASRWCTCQVHMVVGAVSRQSFVVQRIPNLVVLGSRCMHERWNVIIMLAETTNHCVASHGEFQGWCRKSCWLTNLNVQTWDALYQRTKYVALDIVDSVETMTSCVHVQTSYNAACSSYRSRVRMGISPLPQPERVQKAVISAMAAFLIALNPQHALAAETITVQESAPAELSPAQMLVQKTTDTQVPASVTEGRAKSIASHYRRYFFTARPRATSSGTVVFFDASFYGLGRQAAGVLVRVTFACRWNRSTRRLATHFVSFYAFFPRWPTHVVRFRHTDRCTMISRNLKRREAIIHLALNGRGLR